MYQFYICFNSFSAGANFSHQNTILTYKDGPRAKRVKVLIVYRRFQPFYLSLKQYIIEGEMSINP